VNTSWHITLDTLPEYWETVEGLKTLCGAQSEKIIPVATHDKIAGMIIAKQK